MIIFNEPGSGAQFGVGFRINFQTTLEGPPGPDPFWHARLFADSDQTQLIAQWTWPFVTGSLNNTHFGWDPLTFSVATPEERSHLNQGDTAYLRVSVESDAGTFDSGVQDVTYNPVQGAMAALLGTSQLTGSATLSPTQSTQLEETHEATQVSFPIPGGTLSVPLGQLVAHPPLELTHQVAALAGASGISQLNPPFGVFSYPVGLWWQFTTVPPNLGLVSGTQPTYEFRMLQLQLVHSIGGVGRVTELVDFNYDQVEFYWAHPQPVAIRFALTFGVVANFRWILAGP